MNLVEIWVTNITENIEIEGLYKITADFNCYGSEELQVTKWLTQSDYDSVMEKGYYLGQVG